MGWLQKHPVVRGLLLAVLAAVFGINVYALNAARLAGNQVPMPFGVGASVVLSGSMEPTLSVGDLLLLKQEDCLKRRFTFAGGEFFEHMKRTGLYSTDVKNIRKKVEDTGLLNVYNN